MFKVPKSTQNHGSQDTRKRKVRVDSYTHLSHLNILTLSFIDEEQLRYGLNDFGKNCMFESMQKYMEYLDSVSL